MFRPRLAALAAFALMTVPAYGQSLTASQSVEVAIITVDETGAEAVTYQTADEIAPGNELRYVLNFENASEEAASNVRLDMPIPAEINLIEGSIESAGAVITYSADRGETFASRANLSVSASDGLTRTATIEDITHVRWTFTEAIAPGQTGSVSYRGILQ